MRIKKLEIFGFKSFGTRQSIIFGDGVTGVVGPNGCGKSNVVDALRWVMGEQNARHLRGAQMQDIIFCGSDKKAALGFAEVTLTLENDSKSQNTPLEYTNFSEIQITRRLYKTNESEFEINKQKVRLKDIQEFFLGTGVGAKAYSIIEQGRVSEMISAKAADRRVIIEEAAGITKYKSKKNAAEKRMQETKINLNRIIDIHNEIEKRVESLSKEKEKLDKLNELKKRIFDIDMHLASHKYLELNSQKNFLDTTYELINLEILEIKRAISFAEVSFDKILKQFLDKKEEVDILEKLQNQHKNSLELLEKDKNFAEQTLFDNQSLVQKLEDQLKDIEKRLFELNQEQLGYESQQSQLNNELSLITIQYDDFARRGQELKATANQKAVLVQTEQEKVVRYASLAAKYQGEISSIKSQEAQRIIELKNTQDENSYLQKDIKEQKLVLLKLSEELKTGSVRQDEIKLELKNKDEEITIHKKENLLVAQNLSNTQKEIIKLSSRLSSLEEVHKSLKWSQSGVSKILASDKKTQIVSVVADNLEVSSGYELLVEKCFFNILDAAILKSSNDLKDLSAWLKSQKASNSTFFCLDQQTASAKTLDLTKLSEFVKIKNDSYKTLINYLDSFYVIDNLENALLLWPQARACGANLITKDFVLLQSDNKAVFLGDNDEAGILKRKNELDSLAQNILEWRAQENSIKKNLDESNNALALLEDLKEKLLQELRPLSFGIVRLKESIHQKEVQLNKSLEQEVKLHARMQSLTSFMANIEEKIAQLQKQCLEALSEHRNVEEKLEIFKSDQTEFNKIYDDYLLEFKKIEISKLSFVEKIKNTQNLLHQSLKNTEHLLSQKQSFLEQIEEKNSSELILQETIRQTAKKIETLTQELERTIDLLKNSGQQCAVFLEQKNAQEKNLDLLKKQNLSKQEAIHQKELLINTCVNNIQSLLERIDERYQIDLRCFITDFHDKILDEKEALKENSALKQKVASIGAVNENAQNEYSEFKNRKEFLSSQIADLTSALTQLEDAIMKINNTTKIRFLEAFNNINKQFSEVFSRLFNGGKAELILSDANDLLNCGVEIMAKPPGKNISSVELMSGGEKALTAISLIMAIFLIKPSPFCLLDEVDAPLDESNVARFSNLVAEMSKFCQMIVITHNRKTMEMADRLYGVTMQDAGLSKIVCVEVNDAFDSLKSSNAPENKAFLSN